MLPNYQACSRFVLKHTTSRYYVFKDGTYAPKMRAQGTFFSKNTSF